MNIPNAEQLFSMRDKVVLITGASSGIGARCAQVLAAAGGRVYATARRMDRLQKLQQEITASGGVCEVLELDVTCPDSVAKAFARLEELGDTPDVLVNNAGIGDPEFFLSIDEDKWQQMIDTNLTGAWRVAHTCAQAMIRAGRGGAIVNTASILGLRVAVAQSSYAVAKAGLVQLTKAMALELARSNIRVNALAPGYILTEINDYFLNSPEGEKMMKSVPMRRYAEVSELDGALLLLCSGASSFMTGAVVAVDGGHLVSSL